MMLQCYISAVSATLTPQSLNAYVTVQYNYEFIYMYYKLRTLPFSELLAISHPASPKSQYVTHTYKVTTVMSAIQYILKRSCTKIQIILIQ